MKLGSVLLGMLAGAGLLVLLAVMLLVREIILLTFAGGLLAIALDVPVSRLIQYGLGRRTAIFAVLSGLAVVVILVGMLALPTIAEQGDRLVNRVIPLSLHRLDLWLRINQDEIEEGLSDLPGVDKVSTDDLQQGISDRLMNIVDGVVGAVGPVFQGVVNTIAASIYMLFVALFFLADPHVYKDGVIWLVPHHYQPRLSAILNQLNTIMRRWISVTMLSMILMGLGVWLGLLLFGVPNAALLGLITGLTSFAPNFGPIIALIPALAVAITTPEVNPLEVIAVIYGLTFLQNQILLPILMSQAVRIPPLLIIVAQVVMGILFGFLGLMLAVPILIVLTVLVREIYVVDVLRNEESSIAGIHLFQPVDA